MFCYIVKLLNIEKLNEDPSLLVPPNLGVLPGSEEARELGKTILQFYTNSDKITWDVIHDFINVSLNSLFSLLFTFQYFCYSY